MIRILLAEDDAAKAANVERLCLGLLPDGALSIQRAATLTDAGERLESKSFDLLILDIQMPFREGEEVREDAGLQFLRTMYDTRRVHLPRYIFGLSAYGSSHPEYRAEFERHNWHVVEYDVTSKLWGERLGAMVFHILDSSAADNDDDRVDLAIITALEEVELEAILALPGEWSTFEVKGDPTIFHRCRFERGGRSVSVVAAAALEMGMPAATAVVMKLITEFRPRYIAMAGIAAGVKGKVGDILVADVSFDYGSGKVTSDAEGGRRFLPDPHPIPLDPVLKAKLSFFKTRTDVIEQIRRRAVGGKIPERLSVRMGPIASGSAVVADRRIVEEIQSLWRKLVGMEMESYGVFLAARLCREPRPMAMSVKSICDFADAKKADAYQRYAAYTSASFLYEFALDLLARGSVEAR